MIKKLFLLIVLVILLTSGVFALGVTPGRTTLNFEPGIEKEFSFSIINSESKDIGLSIVIDGDLSKYVTLSESDFEMSAEETDKKINCKINLPFSLEPGRHSAKIFVLEKGVAAGGKINIGAVVGVITELVIFVPYPGKYLEVGINTIGPDEDGGITFVLPVVNRGSEDIASATATLDIIDAKGEKFATINTNEVSVPNSERRELTGKLNQEIPIGRYNISISIYFDGNFLKFEKVLVVGEPLLELKEIRVSDFKLGGIAKFEMIVENMWNEQIIGAYAKIKMYNTNGEVLAEFSSPAQNILPGEQAVLSSYWDSLGVQKNIYDAALFLNYEQKTSEKRFKIDVQENQISIIGVSYVISKGDSNMIKFEGIILLLVSAIVILTIINALWFLLIRKKLLGRRR